MRIATQAFAPIEISVKLISVYRVLTQNSKRWLTNAEIAELSGVKRRTATAHARSLAAAGIVDRFEDFGSYGFRFNPKVDRQVLLKLEQAAAVIGA
jgi:DNA-binding MarR family transcriptional regulator